MPITDRMRELHQVASLLDALQLRARVARSWPGRHSAHSHTASAGMFELLSGLVAAEEATASALGRSARHRGPDAVCARSILANPEGQPGAWSGSGADARTPRKSCVRRWPGPDRRSYRDGDLASAVAALRRDDGSPLPAGGEARTGRTSPSDPTGLGGDRVPLLPGSAAERGQACRRRRGEATLANPPPTCSLPPFMTPDRDSIRTRSSRSAGGTSYWPAAGASPAGWRTVDIETGIAHGTTLTLRLPARPRVRPPDRCSTATPHRPIPRSATDRPTRKRGNSGRRHAGRRAEQIDPRVQIEPRSASSGVQDARSSSSTTCGGPARSPNRADAVWVTVPPTAGVAGAVPLQGLDQPTPADLGQQRIAGHVRIELGARVTSPGAACRSTPRGCPGRRAG